MTDSYKDVARLYVESGWAGVLPLPPGRKDPPPTGFTGKGAPDPDEAQVALWVEEKGDGNVGLRLPENVVGIDVDQYIKDGLQHDGAVNLEAFRVEHSLPPLPPTWTSTSRGADSPARIHFYWVHSTEGFKDNAVDGVQIIRHHHRYAVVWPSIHPEGRPYEWYDPFRRALDEPPPADDLSDLPPEWFQALQQRERRPPAPMPPGAKPISGHQRDLYLDRVLTKMVDRVRVAATTNNALNVATYTLGGLEHHGLNRGAAFAALERVAHDLRYMETRGYERFVRTFNSGWEAGRLEPLELPYAKDYPPRSWDDFGNAHRLVDHHGRRVRWVQAANRWATYEDGTWKLDGSAQALAQDVIDTLDETEAEAYPPGDQAEEGAMTREKFLAWVNKQRYANKVTAMLNTAKGIPALAAELTDFDADPWLLNVRNGVIDLRSGALSDHSPEAMMMVQAPVVFDGGAAAPRWAAFLERVMPDLEVRAYLQRITGYTLTGLIGEQAMFLHYGNGANGKSVYLDTLSAILGGYGQVVPRSTLLTKQSEGAIPNDVARMLGKRFLQASETSAGRRLDEEMVKGLTGGEKATARFMRGEFFDFTPTGKIHLATNHLPHMSQADSIWRRLHLVEWEVEVPEGERVQDLAKILAREEAPGILNWALEGCRMWQERGLQPPTKSRERLKAYRDEEDVFGAFLAERLVEERDHFEASTRLFYTYRVWCEESNIRPMTVTSFSGALKERGFEKVRRRDANGFVGLRPVSDLPSRPPS